MNNKEKILEKYYNVLLIFSILLFIMAVIAPAEYLFIFILLSLIIALIPRDSSYSFMIKWIVFNNKGYFDEIHVIEKVLSNDNIKYYVELKSSKGETIEFGGMSRERALYLTSKFQPVLFEDIRKFSVVSEKFISHEK